MRKRTMILCLTMVTLFVLTFFPGAVELNTTEGGVIPMHYYSLPMSGDFFSFLSGAFTGVAFLLGLVNLFRARMTRPTACGVLLVLASISGLISIVSRMSGTILMVVITIGQLAAAVFVFLGWKMPHGEPQSVAEKKHTVLQFLAVSALFAMMLIPCKSIGALLGDGSGLWSYARNAISMLHILSLLLTGAALVIMLLRLIGVLRNSEIAVGILLLLAAASTISFVFEALTWSSPLIDLTTPLVVVVTVGQFLLGIHLLIKRSRRKRTSITNKIIPPADPQ